MKKILSCLLFLAVPLPAWADYAPTLRITLDQVVDQAFKNSPRYQIAQLDYESASKHASSQKTSLYPRLSFDASYRYQTEIPEFSPVPGGPKVPFGDHKNYSFGPAVNWTLWDSGANYARWKSSHAQAQAKFFELDAFKRQLMLDARMAYFQVQLALEQVRALSESLLWAQQQYDDISIQQRAGTLSRIDLLSSHQELLSRKRELREARIDLATALRELFALTGLGKDVNPSIPFGTHGEKKFPKDIEQPTVLLDLDPLAQTASLLRVDENATLDLNHPRLESLEQWAEAARRNARAIQSQHGPTIQIFAKSTRDYPNGPVLESIQQNTFGVVASLPIFEFNRVTNEEKSLTAQAQSAEQRKEQVRIDIQRDWDKSRDNLMGLVSQRDLNRVALDEAKKLVNLVYDSYKAGRSTYLEVQNANFKALLADVQSVRTDIQILIQLAAQESLAAAK